MVRTYKQILLTSIYDSCHTTYMPSKKKTRSTSAKKVSQATNTASPTGSYDTQIIITVLLLLFVYPLGLIFMWAWMKNWPTWVKVVISLPFLFGLFMIFVFFYFVGTIIRHGAYRGMAEHHFQQMMESTPTPVYNTY